MVVAAHNVGVLPPLTFTGTGQREPASSRSGFGAWQELVLFGIKEL